MPMEDEQPISDRNSGHSVIKSSLGSNYSRISTRRSEIELSVHYPEDNPHNALPDVVKVMAFVGLFDGLQ